MRHLTSRPLCAWYSPRCVQSCSLVNAECVVVDRDRDRSASSDLQVPLAREPRTHRDLRIPRVPHRPHRPLAHAACTAQLTCMRLWHREAIASLCELAFVEVLSKSANSSKALLKQWQVCVTVPDALVRASPHFRECCLPAGRQGHSPRRRGAASKHWHHGLGARALLLPAGAATRCQRDGRVRAREAAADAPAARVAGRCRLADRLGALVGGPHASASTCRARASCVPARCSTHLACGTVPIDLGVIRALVRSATPVATARGRLARGIRHTSRTARWHSLAASRSAHSLGSFAPYQGSNVAP